MHLKTYVDINYFYYLHMGNTFLKICHVFFKHFPHVQIVTFEE
jgi:hypothetical protein